MRPKLSRDSLVADFERARFDSNVHELSDKRDRIGVTYDQESNSLTIAFRDPTVVGGIHLMDLSTWLSRPGLALPFAQAFYLYGTAKQPSTRKDTREALTEFLKYLPIYEQSENKRVLCLVDVTQHCVDAYSKDLRGRLNKKGESFKPTTVSGYLVPLRAVFKKLRTIEYEGFQLPRAVEVPTLGYGHRKDSIDHVVPLDDITTVRVVIAAILELEALALAKPIQGFPVDAKGRIREDLTEERALALLEKSESSSPEPLTARELIPFVVMLDLTTDFNCSTMLCAPLSGVQKSHNLYGKKRWVVSSRKWRGSGALQRRSFSVSQFSWANPVYLIAALERYTQGLRTQVPVEEDDRLFIGVDKKKAAATLYDRKYGAKALYKQALHAFCLENDIKPFSLNQLRPTGSDVVHEITEGDVVKQKAALQHQTEALDLAAGTYTSPAAMRRDQERLAKALVWREAFIRSKGKIDATQAHGNPKRAPRAATPGFACFDIFDSPLPGQVSGAPCSGYCLCPDCPLASCNVHDDFSIARVLQVEEALDSSRATVESVRWKNLYSHQLEAIREQWLPLVPAATLERAKKLSLPDIPFVE